MAYDVPSNVTGMVGMTQYINMVSGGNFGWIWLLGWFLISLIVSSKYADMKSALIVASVTTAIFSILMRALELVSPLVNYFTIILAVIAVGIAFKNN